VLAWTLLHLSISSNLKPIAASKDLFASAKTALAEACSKNLLIKLGNKLYLLISLVYVPGTSIENHILVFTGLYTALKSAIATTKYITFDSTMAGILFLKILRHNKTLAPLIQNLYDIEPFSFEKLAEKMNVDDSWSERSLSTLNVIGLCDKLN
jgi:hypothetical protein